MLYTDYNWQNKDQNYILTSIFSCNQHNSMHGLHVKRHKCFPENDASICFEVPRYVLFLPDLNRKVQSRNKYE